MSNRFIAPIWRFYFGVSGQSLVTVALNRQKRAAGYWWWTLTKAGTDSRRCHLKPRCWRWQDGRGFGRLRDGLSVSVIRTIGSSLQVKSEAIYCDSTGDEGKQVKMAGEPDHIKKFNFNSQPEILTFQNEVESMARVSQCDIRRVHMFSNTVDILLFCTLQSWKYWLYHLGSHRRESTQGIHPGFATQSRRHQKFITWVSVAPRKDLCPPKIKK